MATMPVRKSTIISELMMLNQWMSAVPSAMNGNDERRMSIKQA